MQWIQNVKKQGYNIIDIGVDQESKTQYILSDRTTNYLWKLMI